MVDVIIPSENGKIHLVYQKAENPKAPIAIILSGDPLKGMHMNERVTYATFRAFADAGFAVVRFNYRGVGLSTGRQEDPLENMMDLSVVIDWIQNKNEDSDACWIAGYDFGSWLVCQALMRRPEINGFVMISPEHTRQDLSFLSPRPSKGILFQGEKEDPVSLSYGKFLIEMLDSQSKIITDLHYIKDADEKYAESADLKHLYNEIKNYVGRESLEMKIL